MIQLKVTSPYNKALSISSVPLGQTGQVHIVGRHHMATEQKLGVRWVITDPNGLLVELYPDPEKDIEWQFTKIKSTETHEFKGDHFEFFTEGIYTIAVELFMNPDNPVVVDSYDGALATVVIEEEPEPEPEPEEKINWLPIILIGGGVGLAAVALIPKKK